MEKISVTWRNVRCNLILVMYILGPGEELSQKSCLSVEKCDKYEIWLRNEDDEKDNLEGNDGKGERIIPILYPISCFSGIQKSRHIRRCGGKFKMLVIL